MVSGVETQDTQRCDEGLETRLATLEETGEPLRRALKSGDVDEIATTSATYRAQLVHLWPELEREAEHNLGAGVRKLFRRLRWTLQAHETWTQARPPDADMVAALPLVWDCTRDLLLVSGALPMAQRQALTAYGQRFVCLHVDALETWDGRVFDAASLREFAQRLEPLPSRTVHRTLGEDASRMLPSVHEVLLEQKNLAVTFRELGPLWAHNIVCVLGGRNAPTHVGALADALRGWPAILVGPGPSLEADLDTVAKLAPFAAIVCSNRSVAAVCARGVVPDIVVVQDPKPLAHQVAAVAHRPDVTWCLELGVDPAFWQVAGPRYMFAGNGAYAQHICAALGDDVGLANGGSVSTASLSVAVNMGANPVVLVGQDLAQSGTQRYAQSADASHVARRTFHTHVPAIGGGTVATSADFLQFLRWFEASATRLAPRVQLINATNAGAHIQGMTHRSLADAGASWTRLLPRPLAFPRQAAPDAPWQALHASLTNDLHAGAGALATTLVSLWHAQRPTLPLTNEQWHATRAAMGHV